MTLVPPDSELIAATSSRMTAGKPFGWDHAEAMGRIKAELTRSGWVGVSVHLEACRRYDEEQRQHLNFSQRRDLARWLGLPWAGGARPARAALTRAEIEYLLPVQTI